MMTTRSPHTNILPVGIVMRTCIISITLTFLLVRVSASYGDTDPNFQSCVYHCNLSNHKSNDNMNMISLVKWTPSELCEYKCMKSITATRLQRKYPIFKYYGHWPFERYLGLEEPASVVFSLLNMVPHMSYIIFNGAESFNGELTNRKPNSYMSLWLLLYALCACNAWLASSFFHSHKTVLFTQYDYVSALAFLSAGLFVCLRRQLGSMASPSVVAAVLVTGTAAFLKRASDMLNDLVSFDSHMRLCIGLVCVTTGLWAGWCLLGGDRSLHSRRLRALCMLCQVWLVLASALEVFDFPPYWEVFDAHSLWHAATVPLGFVWYCFWHRDQQRHTSPNE